MNTPITDYRLIQGLLPKTGKYSLETLIYQECNVASDALSDAEYAYYLGQLHQSGTLRKEIQTHGLESILTLETQIAEVLFRMEDTGVAFDAKRMNDIWVRIRADIAQKEEAIFAIMGERINLNSPKQLQVFFFEKLGLKPIKKNKTGYSVDTDVLEEIAKTHDVARLILEYRSLSKLASTYVDALIKAVDAHDGRIHTTYDSLGAATGRMSSNDPNLQNIPSGDGYAKEIKECFIPSAGNVLMVADYSQIELRILAFLSEDTALIDAFVQNEDIHTRTARFLFEKKHALNMTDDWKPNSEERRIAKTVNFGVIYGITGFGLAKTLGVGPWEAQQYIEAFYEKYPGVRAYYDSLLEKACETGYVETFFGRRRYMPSLNDANKTIRTIAEREAINMPVQGTAADIIKIAMVEIDEYIRAHNLRGRMILQVHDELVFDIPEDEKPIFEKIIPGIMEWVLQKADHAATKTLVPIRVDIGFGANWAEAK